MRKVSSYFNSEWSFAQFKIEARKSKLIFSVHDETILIMGEDKKFFNIKFNKETGGACEKHFEAVIGEPLLEEIQ